MKILWLAHRDPLNPKGGGAEKTLYEVSKRLVSSGHDITLLTTSWKGCKQHEILDGLKIIRFKTIFVTHAAVPFIIIKYKFDVVINDLGHLVPWISPTIFSSRNIIFFRHLHNRSLPGQVASLLVPILSALEKTYSLIYRRGQFVTESSTSILDLEHLGIKADRISKIEPGVDSRIFHVSIKTNYPSIVYFGGMRRYKRPDESLFALKTLRNAVPSLRMSIVGEGPEYHKVIRRAKELGVIEIVNFTGRLEVVELAKLVSRSWLNIHTSMTEGWGLSIIEAAACGTPTVAYNVPGVVDVVEDGLNGIKVKDGDRDALADAVLKILSNPAHWWSSSRKVAEKYSWEKAAIKWEKLLKEVVV